VRYLEVSTVGDLLVRGAVRHADRAAVVVDDQRATYAELLERATSIARGLVRLGVDRGDRVAILMANGLDHLEVLFACQLLGAVAVPVNARFRTRELRHVIPHLGVSVTITSDRVEDQVSYADRLVEAFPSLADHGPADDLDVPLHLGASHEPGGAPDLRHVVMLGTTVRDGFVPQTAFEGGAAEVQDAEVELRRARVRLRDPAVIFATSGTTALPKGCVLSHEAMVRQGIATAERLGARDGDVVYSPLPMFHTGCTQVLVAILHAGGTYVSQTRVDAAAGLEAIRREGVTLLFPAFAAITEGLLDADGYDPELLRDVRVLFHIGSPEQLRAIQARAPDATRVVTGFGMTEVAGSVAISEPDAPMAQREVPGRALPGAEIGVIDPHGTFLDPGTEGELVVRSPTMFSGYHGDPERTADSHLDGGWYRTGDLGSVDADGLLRFRGRVKDMLKIGGENVGAVEIESHLEAHPAVAAANVVGVVDDRLGEVAVAFVELVTGAEATEAELIDHCRGQIASYKVPRHVRFVTEWPMSATKVRKVDLRARIAEELGLPVLG
jgi:fatty-acyl-CoA synthase